MAETPPSKTDEAIRQLLAQRIDPDGQTFRRRLAMEILDRVVEATVTHDHELSYQRLGELHRLSNLYPDDASVQETFAKALAVTKDTPDDLAGESVLREIDAILARLDVGVAQENASLDKLLQRLTRAAA